LSFTLTGKGVRALQEGAVLPITSLPWPELPALGIFATVQGLCVQGALLLALALSAVLPWLGSRRALHEPAAEPR
jgi:high-affinity Fe2+/Pb2+ permease